MTKAMVAVTECEVSNFQSLGDDVRIAEAVRVIEGAATDRQSGMLPDSEKSALLSWGWGLLREKMDQAMGLTCWHGNAL